MIAATQPQRGRIRIGMTVPGAIGISLVVLIVGLTILAPSISPFSPSDQDLYNLYAAPNLNSAHILGTDAIADLTDRPLGPGAGFGLGFQVLTDTALAEVPGSEGTLSWSGVYGTTFWADRERRLIGIVMLQRVPSASLGISGRFRRIAYAAVTR